MPGIFGVCCNSSDDGANTLNRMIASSSSLNPTQCVENYRSQIGMFASIHHGLFDHSVIAISINGDVGVILDGWVWNSNKLGTSRSGEQELDSAHACLRAYLEYGVSFVRRLNGEFNIVVWDERQSSVILMNDRYGLRPLQYGFFDERLYFAPEGKAILAGAKIKPVLNKSMILNWLSIGRALIGNKTFFEGVDILPPASILCWKNGKIENNCYWDYIFDPIPKVEEDFVRATAETFQRAVSRRIRPNRKYGLTLSGGLDSRVVAQALVKEVGKSVVACTFGIPDSSEVVLANLVADRLGMSWICLPLGPDAFVKNATDGVQFTEGMEIFVQSYGLNVFPKLRSEVDVSLTGLALDLTMGGSYLNDILVDPRSTEDEAKKSVYAGLSYFDDEMVAQLFGSKDYSQIAWQQFTEEWQRGSSTLLLADKADRFALHNRVRRTTFLRQNWQRLFLEDTSPTFDNDFIDLLLRIPASERFNHKFYQRFMELFCPDVMDIPYQRTLLPPSVPIDLWHRGLLLEEDREKLLLDVWRESNGTVYLPYKRYSTNYDEWFRMDPSWRIFSDNLLSSANTRVYEIGIRPEPVFKMIEEHRSGKRSHRARLLQLMTLELLIRLFF